MKLASLILPLFLFSLLTDAAQKNVTSVDQINGSSPRNLQTAMAKGAAPPEVSDAATIYVLDKSGYIAVQQGSNGFSCLIGRERPDTVEPACFDAEGSATTLKTLLRTEELRAQGKSEDEIAQDIAEGYKTGRFQAPRKAGIVYMLSNSNRVFNPETKKVIPFPGHLMFYAPYATAKEIGSGEGAPYVVHPGQPDALMIVIPQRSDASAKASHDASHETTAAKKLPVNP